MLLHISIDGLVHVRNLQNIHSGDDIMNLY